MKNICFILLGISLLSATTISGPGEDTGAKIKVIFIYNFTKYIEWPQNYKEGNFVIGILGNNSGLLTELDNMTKTKKKVGNQEFEIKTVSSPEVIPKCNILYVSASAEVKIAEIVNKLKGKSTLIISEKPGAIKQGAVINFVVQDNKQQFELNKTNAEKYNLKISSALSALAVQAE